MKKPEIIITLIICAITLIASSASFGQEKDYDYSTIPADTTIMSNKDATITMNTPDGVKTIRLVNAKRIKAERDRKLLTWAGVAGVAIAALCVFLYSKRKNKRISSLEKQIQQDKEDIQQMEENIKVIQSHSDSMSASVLGMLEDRVAIIKSIIERHDSFKRHKEGGNYFEKMESLKDTISQYKNHISGLRKDVDLLGGIEDALNSGQDNIMGKLRDSFGDNLSEEDYRILSGVFIGMTPKSLSFVTGIPAGTLRVRKTRYKKKIEGLPESPEKRLFLHLFDTSRGE